MENKINAQIIADSISTEGYRLTTMVIKFPRYILAELNTHRAISKNSASSRAKPFKTMLKSVEDDPFIPVAWMKDHKGMQGAEFFSTETVADTDPDAPNWYRNNLIVDDLKEEWLSARNVAVEQAKSLSDIGLTKQLVNRLLEPFMWHEVVVTASEFENFFGLRCPQYEISGDINSAFYTSNIYRSRREATLDYPSLANHTDLQWRLLNKGMADIHIMDLAEAMWDAYQTSKPVELEPGQWHMPYTDGIFEDDLINLLINEGIMDRNDYFRDLRSNKEIALPYLLKISAARCARISYKTFGEDSKIDLIADVKLHDNLLVSQPIHASPAEHQGRAMSSDEILDNILVTPEGAIGGVSRNFIGWTQYRTLLKNETIR